MVKLNYKDTITLIKTEIDGWNKHSISHSESVSALFVSNTGYSRSSGQNIIDSTASVYVDPTNQFIKDNWNRLEEMYVVSRPYGGEYAESWYKITNVDVGQDKLLGNNIDNILLSLKKTTELSNAS